MKSNCMRDVFSRVYNQDTDSHPSPAYNFQRHKAIMAGTANCERTLELRPAEIPTT